MQILMQLLFCAFFSLATVQAEPEVPNPGPRIKEEPKLLYEEALTAFKNEKYALTIHSLERFIARYPLDKNFIPAHRILGEAQLKLSHFEAAIKPLHDFLRFHFLDHEGNQVRLLLTDAYLKTNKLSEARAICDEIFKHKPTTPIRNAAVMIKTLVLIQQHRIQEARASFDAFENENQSAEHTALFSKVKFTLKTAECSHAMTTVSKGKNTQEKNTSEERWLAQLQHTKLCFKNSLTPELSQVSSVELGEWCKSLKENQKLITKQITDRSFHYKIKDAFENVKTFVKETYPTHSKELLGCDDRT